MTQIKQKDVFIVGKDKRNYLYGLYGIITPMDKERMIDSVSSDEEHSFMVDENAILSAGYKEDVPFMYFSSGLNMNYLKEHLQSAQNIDVFYDSPTSFLDKFLTVCMPLKGVGGALFNTRQGPMYGFSNMVRDSKGSRKSKHFTESFMGGNIAYVIESHDLGFIITEENFAWDNLERATDYFHERYLSTEINSEIELNRVNFIGIKLSEGNVESFNKIYSLDK